MKTLFLFIIITCFQILCTTSYAQQKLKPFRDTTDNAIDISNWLLRKEGFLPIPTVITEPAVGFGGAAAIIFFHSSFAERKGAPNMTGIMGGATENDTWGAGAFHAGFWKDDKIRYAGALIRSNINIQYYGPGIILSKGINMNMDAWLLLQQIKFRISSSNFFIGGKYMFTNTTNTFELPLNIPEFNGVELKAQLSEVSAIFNYDSRNNVFTPTQGLFAEIISTYSDDWMGGEALYGRITGGLLGFMQLDNKLNLAVRIDSRHSLGDAPFWTRPIIDMRGVPVMKYQNKHVDLMEIELSYNIYRRWYLKGFTGIGNAYKNMDEFSKGKSVRNIGTGFRYELARIFGLHMGMDFAWSNDDFGFYIVMGHSWMR